MPGRKPTNENQTNNLLIQINEYTIRLLDAFNFPYYVIDPKTFTIIYANKVLGKIPSNAKCYEITHKRTEPCNCEEHCCMVQKVLQTKQHAVASHTHYDSTGNEIFVDVHAHPIFDNEGNVSQIVEYSIDVTKQKITEEKLAFSEEKFNKAFHNSPDIIAITKASTGKIIDVNDNFCKVAGYTREEVLGNSSLEMNIWVNPKERELFLHKLTKTKEVKNMEIDVRLKTGEIRKGLISGSFINIQKELYILAVIRDITERKKNEKELIKAKESAQENETKYKTLINVTNAGFVMLNMDGFVIDANPEYVKLSGHKELSEIIGKKVTDWTAEYDIERNANEVEKCINNKFTENLHIDYIHNDGTIIPVEIFAGVIKLGANDVILASARNISNRKKAEKDLIKAKEKAEESDRLKSAFLANMSHEIRTPMNGIIGFSDMLSRPNLQKEKQDQFISLIQECGKHLLNIIDDLIDIAKIETNQILLSKSDINLDEFLSELYTLVKPKADTAKLELSFVQNQRKCTINTDKARLKQIFINLLNNAVKFTPKGSVNFGYSIKDTKIEFFVSDTGIGIEKNNFEKIFEHFRQADDGISRRFGGTGLGLSIAKSLTTLLGGEIWIESEINKGSTFFFSIPYESSHQKIKKIADSVTKNSNFVFHKHLNILVAEDEMLNFLLIEEALSVMDAKIIHAFNGKEAVEIVKNNKNLDIILMDLKMGVMDGFEATRQIKKIRNNLPIIAQTAYAQEADKMKALLAGCDDYIVKPININNLINLINKYIS